MQLEGNVLKISLSNGLTRAARPIYDNEATNNINRIQLRFFKYDDKSEPDDYIRITKVDEDLSFNGNVITIGNNPPEQITVELDMTKAKKQNVYIFAYGYNVDGEETPLVLTANKDFSAKNDYILMDNQSVSNSVDLQEYFAGSVRAYINDYGLFNESPEITLKRQVAGLLVYLKNIPAVLNDESGVKKEVKYITVNAAMTTTGLVMPAEGIYRGKNNNDRENEGKFANGYTGSDSSQELLRFDLTGAKRSPKDALTYTFEKNEDIGGVDFNQVIFAENMDASKFKGKKFANNTLFGSCFILPFAVSSYSLTNSSALYINYLDEDGDIINTALLHMSSGGSAIGSYSIWANHFYSIGTKIGDADDDVDDDGIPDTDEDGDDDPDEEDEPLDISGEAGTKALIMNVDDMWEDVTLIRPE